MTVFTYVVYLVVSAVLTVWVGRTLFANGRIFLVDAFGGNEEIADSVNHLLLVGFYLINFGYVSLVLRMGYEVRTWAGVIEALSFKIGFVLFIVGLMHFIILLGLSRMRKTALGKNGASRQANRNMPQTHSR